MGPPLDEGRRGRRRSPCGRARRPRRTLRHVVGRRQISTVFYLRKRAGEVSPHTVVHSASIRTERPMPSETDASAQARSDLPDAASPRSAGENPRQRGLFSIPAAAALPLVHRRTDAWPGRDIRSKNRSSPTSCTGRERTSTAVPIRWFGSTPGGSATNCASTTRADPIPSSSRCRRAATCPSSKRIPPHPRDTAPPVVLPEPQADAVRFTNLRRARIAVGALALVAAVIAGRACMARTPSGRRALQPSCSPWPRTQVWRGRLRCPRTATLSPSPGRATPRLVRRTSM